MRILFVLPYVPSPIRVRSYHFIRELAQRHEVSVLAASGAGEMRHVGELQALCPQTDVIPLQLPTMVRSCAAAAVRGEPLQAAVCRSPSFETRLRELLASGCFDVVHVEHLRAAHARSAIPDHMPTVYDAVDCISLLWERSLRSSRSLRTRLMAALELRRTRRYETRQLARFDHVTVTSAVDAQALQALDPAAHLTVVPNGVDLHHFTPLAGARCPATLVFSGKMSYHANVTAVQHFVDDILPLVRRAQPDIQLRIVGSDPTRGVRDLARDPAITVTGYLPDLRDAIGRATIAICPMTVKVGIQNKLLEAMAMGVPVVTTSLGLEGLDAQPDRDLLVADTPARFAQQVSRLLDDAELRDRVGRAGRAYVECFHRWDAAAHKLERLYAEAMHARRAAA
jgi:sugar transferase (PEP-CTERM/EpsH1 system associated)